ncbi:MAG: hypothetical protein EAS51_01010 [Microbacteriaceae bacterium]|nr:MAG: hypothetical protein EAS51_01010 [Microbacteriaceae bacterium]
MDWQQRITAVWAEADALDDAELVRRIDDIAAEHPDEPLALVDLGRPVEAVAALLHALTPHLPRYQRSVPAYADALLE